MEEVKRKSDEELYIHRVGPRRNKVAYCEKAPVTPNIKTELQKYLSCVSIAANGVVKTRGMKITFVT